MACVRDERGMVLLLVLLVVALLATVLTELSFSTLVDLRMAETFRDTTRSTYLARGGLEVGQMILKDDDNNYDATDELWALGVQQYPVADGSVTIEITDLSGRIDLNQLYSEKQNSVDAVIGPRYQRLLEELDVPQPEALIDTLVDWLDPNEIPEGQGAESAEYTSRSEPYQCKNGQLDTLDELVMVEGYSQELLNRLRPHVTAYGSSTINVNTASREVLLSLAVDVDVNALEVLLAARHKEPLTAVSQIKDLEGMDMESLYFSISSYLDVKSQSYQIVSTGRVNDGRTTLQAVVEKVNNKTKIKFQRVL